MIFFGVLTDFFLHLERVKFGHFLMELRCGSGATFLIGIQRFLRLSVIIARRAKTTKVWYHDDQNHAKAGDQGDQDSGLGADEVGAHDRGANDAGAEDQDQSF